MRGLCAHFIFCHNISMVMGSVMEKSLCRARRSFFKCYLYWPNFDVQDRENLYAFHSTNTTLLRYENIHASPVSVLAVSSLFWDFTGTSDGSTTIQCTEDLLMLVYFKCYAMKSYQMFFLVLIKWLLNGKNTVYLRRSGVHFVLSHGHAFLNCKQR